MIKAIIFDLDNVLVESEIIKFQAINKTYKDLFGVDIPDNDTTWIGRDEKTNMRYFLDLFNLDGDIDKIISLKRKNYHKLINDGKVKEIKGSIEFLKKNYDKGIAITLATNSPREDVECIISYFNIKHFIKIILCKEDIINPKPHPEIFLKIMAKLGCNPNECIAIEDSPSGIKAAKAAGIRCIGITTSFNKKQLLKADIIVNNFNEIKL